MIDRKALFLNKTCTLEKKNGFVLTGIVLDIKDDGIIFKTSQLTSFISWSEILSLIPVKVK